MKLPVNFLLYLCSAGLLAQAGMWFVAASPKLKGDPPEKFHGRGASEALKQLTLGRGMASSGANWVYGSAQGWWERFKNVNLIGKEQPKPKEVEAPTQVTRVESPDKPIEQIIDLVSLAHDGPTGGKGGDTHVVVRYKPDSGVKPPEERMRALASPMLPGPRDAVVPGGKGRPARAGGDARTTGAQPAPAPVPMPVAGSGTPEILQQLRPGQSLWKDYEEIKLLEVSQLADMAVFVRVKPDAPAGTEPKRMELLKSNMSMSADVAKMVRKLRDLKVIDSPGGDGKSEAVASAPSWLDVEETTRQGDTWHIGKNDVNNFGENNQARFLERINADAYVSRIDSSVRGVQVRNVDSQLGRTYGVQSGDVLKSINDEPVRNQAEVINVIRKQYNIGTRTFRTRWLQANGQEAERVYQAPPGRNNS